jgi:hypothetical protein
MDKKAIAKLVFVALVEECKASKYRAIKDDGAWYYASKFAAMDLGETFHDNDFSEARYALLAAGFVERRNIRHQAKWSGGFFTVQPTEAGLKRLAKVGA